MIENIIIDEREDDYPFVIYEKNGIWYLKTY